MHRSRSPRAQAVRLIIVYTAMTLVVLVSLTILLLFIQGYRFNAADRSLEQGGLVQFESKPSGATVTFDNRVLSRKTATRLSATSGSHTVVINRDGYRPWQKTITVDPGTVHWLNYVMLVPDELEPTTEFTYQQIDQSLPAYKKNKLALLPDDNQPRVDIIDAGLSQPSKKTVEIPERLVVAGDSSSVVKIELISWDETANRLLAKVSAGKSSQWLVVDTREPARSVNISSLFADNTPVQQVLFDARSSKHVYVLSKNSLYRVAYEDSTVPEPIATNIASLSQSLQGVIAFTTTYDKEEKSRSTGYYTPGADRTKSIQSYYDNGSPSLRLRTGEYFDDQYLVVQYGSTVEISRLSLHPSDDDQALTPVSIATINLEDGVEYLDFSPTERFVVAQHKSSFTTYDLEHLSVDSATVRGESPVKSQLTWLDDFHIWSGRDDELRIYEFDGQNGSFIGDIGKNQIPLLTKSGKYLYFVSPVNDKQQSLLRVQLF